MKVLVIVCSARKHGNTDQLADAYIKGAEEQNHIIRKYHLAEIELHPCLGCNGCVKTNRCVQKDGMQALYEDIKWCDLIVFATPLYFWGISAQMKMVIDRLYALGEKDPKGYFKYPRKCSSLLVTAADSDSHFWTFESVEQYYHRLVTYLKWTDKGILAVGSCGGTAIKRRIEETGHLEAAYNMGKQLQ